MKKHIEVLKENKTLLMGVAMASGLVMLALLVFVVRFIAPSKEDILLLKPASFEHLDGWKRDNQLRSISAFKKSCNRIVKKNPEAKFGRGGYPKLVSDI